MERIEAKAGELGVSLRTMQARSHVTSRRGFRGFDQRATRTWEATDRGIASPHWRRRAGGTLLGQLRFLDEINRRISYPYTDKPEFGDAIAHWATVDSWREPSAPTHAYSPARMQGVLSPLHGGSLKRHEKSALWFSRNRKAGSALLRHNHIRPVIDRTWAQDSDRIEGAIWHSKRTDQQLLDQTARERVEQKEAR
ncbi:hypothetical protein [Streptomyces sp. DSM 118878]